jgi:hypothetical protein
LNIAIVINTYGISEGIAKIKWKLCEYTLETAPPLVHLHIFLTTWTQDIVYCCWIAFEIFVIWKWFVETAGKTLEELSVIFEAPNPRNESLKKTKARIDASGNVLAIHED